MAEDSRKIWLRDGKVLVNDDGNPYYTEECCCGNGSCWQRYTASCIHNNGQLEWSEPQLVESTCAKSAPNGHPNEWVLIPEPENPDPINPYMGAHAERWEKVEGAKCKDAACSQEMAVPYPDFPCQCEALCADGNVREFDAMYGPIIALPIGDVQVWKGAYQVASYIGVNILSILKGVMADPTLGATVQIDPYVDQSGVPLRYTRLFGCKHSIESIFKSLKCCGDVGSCQQTNNGWIADGLTYTYINRPVGTPITGRVVEITSPVVGGVPNPLPCTEGFSCEATHDLVVQAGKLYASVTGDNCTYTGQEAWYEVFTDDNLELPFTIVRSLEQDRLCDWGVASAPGRWTYQYYHELSTGQVMKITQVYNQEYGRIEWVLVPDTDHVWKRNVRYVDIPGPPLICERQFGSQQWGSINAAAGYVDNASIWWFRLPKGAAQKKSEWNIACNQLTDEKVDLPGSPLWDYKFYLVCTENLAQLWYNWIEWKTNDQPDSSISAAGQLDARFCPEYKIMFVTETWYGCEHNDSAQMVPFGYTAYTPPAIPAKCHPVNYAHGIYTFNEEYPEPYFASGNRPDSDWDGKRSYWLHENDEDVNPGDESPVVPALRPWGVRTDEHAYQAIRMDIHNYPSWCDIDHCQSSLNANENYIPVPDFADSAWFYFHCSDILHFHDPQSVLYPAGRTLRHETIMDLDCYAGPPVWSAVSPIEHIGGGYMDDICEWMRCIASKRSGTCMPDAVTYGAGFGVCGGEVEAGMDWIVSGVCCPDMRFGFNDAVEYKETWSCVVTSAGDTVWHEVDARHPDAPWPISCWRWIPFESDCCGLPEGVTTWEGTPVLDPYPCLYYSSDHGVVIGLHASGWYSSTVYDYGSMIGTRWALKDGGRVDLGPVCYFPTDSAKLCGGIPVWSPVQGESCAISNAVMRWLNSNIDYCSGLKPIRAKMQLSYVASNHGLLADVTDENYPEVPLTIHSQASRLFDWTITSIVTGVISDFRGLAQLPGHYVLSFDNATIYAHTQATRIYDETNWASQHLSDYNSGLESIYHVTNLYGEPDIIDCESTITAGFALNYIIPSACSGAGAGPSVQPGCALPVYGDWEDAPKGGCGTAYSYHSHMFGSVVFTSAVWNPDTGDYDTSIFVNTTVFDSYLSSNVYESSFFPVPPSQYDWENTDWNQVCGQDITDSKFYNNGKCAYGEGWTNQEISSEVINTNTTAVYLERLTGECWQEWSCPTGTSMSYITNMIAGEIVTFGSRISSWQHNGSWNCSVLFLGGYNKSDIDSWGVIP